LSPLVTSNQLQQERFIIQNQKIANSQLLQTGKFLFVKSISVQGKTAGTANFYGILRVGVRGQIMWSIKTWSGSHVL